MQIVKRMYAARVFVLTIALGAGGVAACLASGSDKKSPPSVPVARLQMIGVRVARSETGLGLDLGDRPARTPPAATATNRTADLAPGRGYGVDVARYGVPSPTTT
jgi:pilus assembly protein CpaB